MYKYAFIGMPETSGDLVIIQAMLATKVQPLKTVIHAFFDFQSILNVLQEKNLVIDNVELINNLPDISSLLDEAAISDNYQFTRWALGETSRRLIDSIEALLMILVSE